MTGIYTFLKDYRVSLGMVAAVLMALWWAREWQYRTFVTRNEVAAESVKIDFKFEQLMKATLSNTQVIERNFNEFRLYTAVKSVEQYEDALYQYESSAKDRKNSPSDDARGQSLRTRLAKAEGYKSCILEGKNDCEELLKLWRDRD